MSVQVKVGDVFGVPLEGGRWGFGQLAGDWKGELYVVLYGTASDALDGAETALGEKPVFAALTLDAKLHHGDWPVLGNEQSNLAGLPHPAFKVNISGTTFVEARDRSKVRPATAEEETWLRFRTVVAPVRLQSALSAHHGLVPWETKYNPLRVDYAERSSGLLG